MENKYNFMNNFYTEQKNIRNEYECIIYLLRHGESVGNLNKVVLGHTNLSLTEKGKEQALLSADYLRNIEFDAIYSSDLDRAYSTALPSSLYHGLGIVKDARFRELGFGDWENRPVVELIDEYGDMFWKEWRGDFGRFTPPNGEAVVDAAKRVVDAVMEIARRHVGGAVLVASHAAVIRGAWAWVLGLDPSEWAEKVDFPTNASFSILGYREGKLYPIVYSVDEHLGDIKTGVPKSIN